MKQLTLRELQLAELDILKRYAAFCKKHNLKYSLIYGTLIGAARHQVFIPWDDDIDVCMPRPDYERLLSLAEDFNHATYKLIANPLGHSLDAIYAAIINTDIPCVNMYTDTMRSSYLWIDIFPVDGFAADDIIMKGIYLRSRLYQKMVKIAGAKYNTGKSTAHRLGKLFLIPLCRLYGIQRCLDRMDLLAKSYPYDTANDIGIIAWGEGPQERFPKTGFDNMQELEFEGQKFPVLSCWKDYLKNMYGDYTQLPPESERIDHNIIAYKKQ